MKKRNANRPEKHSGRLHNLAKRWLATRAIPESVGGLGVFADTRYCLQLTQLLARVERAAVKRATRAR